MFKNFWTEKYRPANLSEFLSSKSIADFMQQIVDNKETANLLLVGIQGIGKTSLAKIIVTDILKCQYLYINASDENGVDTMRGKVISFAQTKSLDGNIKTVILDECDGITTEGQRILRNTMEEYANSTRFILTGNYKHKILPAIQSRCQTLDLSFSFEDALKRICYILDQEKIKYENNAEFKAFIKSYYPDLRKTINEIQKCCINGELRLELKDNVDEFIKQIYHLVSKNAVLKIRKFIIENEDKYNSDYQNLLRSLFNYIEKNCAKDGQKKQQLLIVAQHLYQSVFCIDQEINLFACLIAISQIPAE